MSANVTVQGSYPNGGQTQDQAVIIGGKDVGGNSRPIFTNSLGAVAVTAENAAGAALTANPIPAGFSLGGNSEYMTGNAAGQLLVNTEGQKKTYSISGLVTPATAATDIVNLLWSSGVVRILKVGVSFNASAAGVTNVLLLKRSTANSGGTASTPTPVPHDSGDGACNSTVSQYSANPTLGTSLGAIRSSKIGISAASGMASVEWDFTKNNDKAPILRSANQSISINLNGDALLTSELVAYYIEFSEE